MLNAGGICKRLGEPILSESTELVQEVAKALSISTQRLHLQRQALATSSQLHRVSVDGSPLYALRVHDNPAWVMREPDLVSREASALQLLRDAAVPAPLFVCQWQTPLQGLLMSWLPGDVTVSLSPQKVRNMARQLALIHDTPGRVAAQYHSWVSTRNLQVPLVATST